MLAGCASSPDGLKPGASADDIRAQMGTPVATYALPGGGKRLEFRGNGPRTYMLDVDASGRLIQLGAGAERDQLPQHRAGHERASRC